MAVLNRVRLFEDMKLQMLGEMRVNVAITGQVQIQVLVD